MTVLRIYQDRAVAEILAWLQRGSDGVLLESPVGSGKTTMGMDAVKTALSMGWTVAWFTHRKELADQASERATGEGIAHGRLMPGCELTPHKLHVASIDTVTARMGRLKAWLGSVDLAVFDEAHHIAAKSWTNIADAMPRARNLGLTATPFRLDGKGLGESGHFRHVVRCPSIRDLTRAGWLAPAKVYAPPTDLDLGGVKTRAGDYALNEVAAAVARSGISVIGRRWYARHAPGQPAIVFCPTVELAEASAAAYRAAGWAATSVDGTMSARDRAAAIDGLADGSVQVLTSCALIGEGLDIPAVACAILERPTASTSLYVQMIGRALRPHTDKTHAVILDLVGNAGRHGMHDAERPWDLKGGLKGIERAVQATWRCRKCSRVHEKPDQSAHMACGCGNAQAVSGFSPIAVDAHPPVAGVPADQLVRMKFKDAVKLLKTRADLIAYGKLRRMQHPVAWADNVLRTRESYKRKFQPRRQAGLGW